MTGPDGFSQGSSRYINSLMWSFLVGWAREEDEGTVRHKQDAYRIAFKAVAVAFDT